jgi:carbon-monoxide dehydrogenase large subunit
VQITRYAAVDDVGRCINPMIVHGQTHGGIAQGVGQALYEQCHYDPDSGQLLTGSFMDYTMPRAGNTPRFNYAYTEVPTPNNTLGIKGAGEAGTIGATPSVVNAVADALARNGMGRKSAHIQMPMTPFRIWELMQ